MFESTPLFAAIVKCLPMLAVIALIAGALWAGTLFSASWLSGRARWMADATEAGTLAMSLNRRRATPCLLVSLASAVLWVWAQPHAVPDQAWLLGVGFAVVAALAVHSTVLIRTARVARGSIVATRGEGVRRFVLVLTLALLTTLVGGRIVWP